MKNKLYNDAIGIIRRVHRSGWHGESNQPVFFINVSNMVVNEVQSVSGSIPSHETIRQSSKSMNTLRKKGVKHGKNCH